MNKYHNFIGTYCVQSYFNQNGTMNVHATIGSTRKKGGYNYEMDLRKTYSEILPHLESEGLVVTKKYVRLTEGLSFDAKDGSDKIKKIEQKINKLINEKEKK